MEVFLAETEIALRNNELDEAELLINRASLLLNDHKDNLLLVINYKVLFVCFLLLFELN